MLKRVFLDCRKLAEPAAAHSYLQEMLDFPSYYGRTEAALVDMLQNPPWCEIKIVLMYKEGFLPADSYGYKLIEIIDRAMAENSENI